MSGECEERPATTKDSHAVSVDTAGPFQHGIDQEKTGCRYLLLGSVTIPMYQDQPLPEGLQKMGFARSAKQGTNLAQGNAEEATLDRGSVFQAEQEESQEGVLQEQPEDREELTIQ